MIVNTYIQLIGLIIQVAAGCFAAFKGVQSYFENRTKQVEAKSKENIELARSSVEMSKTNTLAATQVATILEKYHEVFEELEDIKKEVQRVKDSGVEKTHEILTLIDKIEAMIKQQTQNFTEFIMGRKK